MRQIHFHYWIILSIFVMRAQVKTDGLGWNLRFDTKNHGDFKLLPESWNLAWQLVCVRVILCQNLSPIGWAVQFLRGFEVFLLKEAGFGAGGMAALLFLLPFLGIQSPKMSPPYQYRHQKPLKGPEGGPTEPWRPRKFLKWLKTSPKEPKESQNVPTVPPKTSKRIVGLLNHHILDSASLFTISFDSVTSLRSFRFEILV